MKYLLLNRHAKSSWRSLNISDYNRKLDKTGFYDASMMGQRLLAKKISFDLMITSGAVRALTTCQLIAMEIKYSLEKINIDTDMYGPDIKQLKKIISRTNDSIQSLAVFGHNPTLHILSEELYKKEIAKFPSCGMFYVSFDTDHWFNCFNSRADTIFFDFPKNE